MSKNKKSTVKRPSKKKNLPAKKANQVPAIRTETTALVQVSEKMIDDYLFGTKSNLNENEKVMFKKTAMMFNLNPFKREIYPVVYDSRNGRKLNVITGYEVYLKKANQLRLLNGWKVDVIGEGQNLKAVITIHRKDWKEPFIHEVFMNEYSQDNKMWREKPITMIKKVAMAQGFRLCFTEEFDGMPYTTDEMPMKDADYDQGTEITENKEDEPLEIVQPKKDISLLRAQFTELYQKYSGMKESLINKVDTDRLDSFMANIKIMEEDEIIRGINGVKILIDKYSKDNGSK